jgi:hypothetical protein
MALKSKEWFYKRCLENVRDRTRFAYLCWDILDKGIGQRDSTRGHVTQAIGATQGFLTAYPQHRATISAADATRPFDIVNAREVLDDWRRWFGSRTQRTYGNRSFGYNYRTLRGYLTRNLGGTLQGGGGGNDEFKRVLRLMAEFM